ncbi:DUF4442 domain-containing protein [Owenweeksia hongkongensis]|uniref:DUF4442 domain-containing protein n=1 Tax=Owenweeksia hongkongensis TaxID=253245 RepID=UPI003A8F331B
MNLPKLAAKAATSPFYRWVLSKGLNTMVPFNGPHKFKVHDIGKHHLEIHLPYRKKNLNHLKGIHACAMATLAEVSSGFLLIGILDPKRYRLILQRLEMDYHYQAKTAVKARFEVDPSFMEKEVVEPLKKEGKIMLPATIKIFDTADNHVATGIAHWQIKSWEKVKTKV